MPLAREELVRRVWLRFKKRGTKVLRDFLIARYMPVVQEHAERICAKLPRCVQLDDMISAGVLGLLDAMDKYDPARAAKFETFASQRIRGAMCDELRTLDMVSRLLRRRAREMSSATESLKFELGRPPSEQEVATRGRR
jgi:RNA polymerase sigma factor for flagellar operon FliA